jgi:glutamyl-tRNA synthetase
MNEKTLEVKARGYALKNAIAHEGKAQAGSVISALFVEGLKKEDMGKYGRKISEIVNSVNKLSLEEQNKEFESIKDDLSERDTREGLQELEDIPKNGVVMRFAPSPSGPMHIGHAATGMPSSIYVKKYGGKFYLRIEDTNPENIDPDAYKMIPEEAKWLFGNVTGIIIQSDRMEKYYDFVEQLIKKDVAYICDCDTEKFKDLIEAQKPCPCRNLSVKENMERWKKMLDKSTKGYKEGDVVLRFKSNLKDSNPAMRDFPLARIVEAKHPRQGNKYKVWPLMNLCVTLDDMEYGMTHIIRAKDHMDNAKRQAMIFEVFNKKIPKTYFLGRYNFNDLEISCSKTKIKIKAGEFTGWDDIRLPFIAALRKRGYQPKAFEDMAVQRGISDVDKVLSQEDYFQLLNNFNRHLLHELAIKVDFKSQKSKGKDSIEILMSNNKVVYGQADLDIKKLKEGSIVHLIGLGYCRYTPKEKVKFWFAHE